MTDLVGSCHLVDAPDNWPRANAQDDIFVDDDLGVCPVVCECGRLYLRVWRRVPGEIWHFLIPVTQAETEALTARIDDAPAGYTSSWAAAEKGVVELTLTRPFLEELSRTPPILRWVGPGKPLAFSIAPC